MTQNQSNAIALIAYRAYGVSVNKQQPHSLVSVALTHNVLESQTTLQGSLSFPSVSEHTLKDYATALDLLPKYANTGLFKHLGTMAHFCAIGTEDKSVYVKVGKSSAIRVLPNPATAKYPRLEKVVFADKQEVFPVSSLILLSAVPEEQVNPALVTLDHESFLRKVATDSARVARKAKAAKETAKKEAIKDKKDAKIRAKVETKIAEHQSTVDKQVKKLKDAHEKKATKLRQTLDPKKPKAAKAHATSSLSTAMSGGYGPTSRGLV